MTCKHHWLLKSGPPPIAAKCKKCKATTTFAGGLPLGTEVLRSYRPLVESRGRSSYMNNHAAELLTIAIAGNYHGTLIAAQ